jgi:hypothetical protein
LKKSRLHGFAGKFIEQLLDIRAIAENEEVKIKCIREDMYFFYFSIPHYQSKVISFFDKKISRELKSLRIALN